MLVGVCDNRREEHCRGRTCPAVGIVAEAMEEDDRGGEVEGLEAGMIMGGSLDMIGKNNALSSS